MPAPNVERDAEGTYTITLFREEKVYHTFIEQVVAVCCVKEDEVPIDLRARAGALPAEKDGLIYYLHAVPYDGSSQSFIWLSKEEASVIESEMIFLEENEDNEPYDEDSFGEEIGVA
jgi:hypothetical protein